MVDCYEMDFMKGIAVLLKVDEMCNILKSASHCLLVERWKWDWMIIVFGGAVPWIPIRLLCASFIKAVEKEFDIAI